MLQKLRSNKGFTLVELMIVVAIIGILAAIAIPAFLRSVKKSKTAEAEQTMRKIGDGAKSYFTSEQRFSAATGDQPWHSGSATLGLSNSLGNPVAGPNYAFPGGDAGAGDFSTHIAAGATTPGVTGAATLTVPPACTTVEVPTNGSKLPPVNVAAFTAIPLATLNKLKINFVEPTYFSYQYTSNGEGPDARADYWACADFDDGSAEIHTTAQTLYTLDGEVAISGAQTWGEFE